MSSIIGRIFGLGGSDRISDPPAIHISPEDSAEDVSKKIDIILKYRESIGRQNRENSIHNSMYRLFNILILFVIIAFTWALYIYGFSVDEVALKKADFIFSTLASAMVASVIGMIATFPRER